MGGYKGPIHRFGPLMWQRFQVVGSDNAKQAVFVKPSVHWFVQLSLGKSRYLTINFTRERTLPF